MSIRRPNVVPRLALGLGVVLLGVVFFLDELGRVDAEQWFRFWPVVPIGIGLSYLVRRTVADLLFGLAWIVAGSWLLLYELELTRISPWDYAWPLVLVAVGTGLIVGAVRRGASRALPEDSPRILAFLSGVQRRSTSPDFRGAELTTLLGGCALDLTDASIVGGTAEVHVFAFWGGFEIRVPKEWHVEMKLLPLLGGVEDSTRQQPSPDAPRLVVRGSVIMAGGEVKN